ncbi:MAG: DoxX family protein [Phycisphaerales bacterium]|nr:DoxX family protein [Phycisphaerales bacterium]
MTTRDTLGTSGGGRGRNWSIAAMAMRVLLGGVFIYSAWVKLQDPVSFGQAIEKFRAVDPDRQAHLIKLAVFAIPWTEMICGVGLVLGLWTRAAALVLGLALAGFMVLIYQVLNRGESFDCGCFGRLRLACPSKLSSCNLWQDGVLLAMALVLLAGGPGRWALDRPSQSRHPAGGTPPTPA